MSHYKCGFAGKSSEVLEGNKLDILELASIALAMYRPILVDVARAHHPAACRGYTSDQAT